MKIELINEINFDNQAVTDRMQEVIAGAVDYAARIAELDESFEDTEAFRWLSENAYKYGFILRYPEDKVDTTGYKYEPLHYRFVGRTVAAEIHASDMCLEEYLKLN